jgi:chorismate mutase/prephenate dehydratase
MAAREPDSAAIAGQLAVDLYGLKLLARDVQDLGGNVTRFLVIGKNYGKPTGDDKTSVYFAVRHKVGALHDALTTLKQNNVNMTKIESRPSRTKAWEYYFFVDLEGHAHDPHLQKALTQMAEHCTLMTILGAYPKAKGREG